MMMPVSSEQLFALFQEKSVGPDRVSDDVLKAVIECATSLSLVERQLSARLDALDAATMGGLSSLEGRAN
jgi:hypothetical protein